MKALQQKIHGTLDEALYVREALCAQHDLLIPDLLRLKANSAFI